jgi:ubiquinone/menaquinone biosynthesis C-methylase UbiE
MWDEKAAFWDRLHGQEGNGFHRTIVEPTVQRLLELATGERVVDAACGNGTMARRLAAWGAEVTAFDFSLRLLRPGGRFVFATSHPVSDTRFVRNVEVNGRWPSRETGGIRCHVFGRTKR